MYIFFVKHMHIYIYIYICIYLNICISADVMAQDSKPFPKTTLFVFCSIHFPKHIPL